MSDTEGRDIGAEERREDRGEGRDPEKWDMVVEMVHTDFQDRVLAEEATCQAVVLILKKGDEYPDIGIVEMLWKAVAVILDRLFTNSITYHDSLHGFRAGRGTWTATLEVKLLQHVLAMREAVLHTIFLYLQK